MSENQVQVTTPRNLLELVTKSGVLISLRVRYWRAHKMLKPEDVGMAPTDVNRDLVSLGHKKLIPPEYIQPFSLIEGRARAAIENATFSFMGVGRFLPNRRLPETQAVLRNLKEKFAEEYAKFHNQFDKMRTEALALWRENAPKLSDTPEALVAAVAASYPEASALRRHYEFEWQTYQVAPPENVDAQLLSDADALEIAEARNRVVEDARGKMAMGVERSLQEIVTQMREQTATMVTEVLETMRTGSTNGVHQKTLDRMRNFINWYRSMNFMDDQQLTAQLNSLEQQFLSRTADDYRHDEKSLADLTTGLTAMRDHARHLVESDVHDVIARFGAMGNRRVRKME